MEKSTVRKRLSIVRLYLSGLSYDEIASKTGVSKGTVANVVAEFKAGDFPEAGDVGEQVDLLRDLSLDLKRVKLSPGQCAVGLIVLNRISECGLDPAHIDRWPMILKSVPSQEDANEFVQVVYSIQQVLQRTGLSLDALESKVCELERKAADLGSISDKVQDCQKQLVELSRQREKLTNSVAMLEQKRKLMAPQVKDLEGRERTLSRRIADIEPKVHKADATLSALHGETRKLEDIGFSIEELAEFGTRLQIISEHHAIETGELSTRLLDELETLDKGLSLEAILQSRQQELVETDKALAVTKGEIESSKAVVDSLKEERMKLQADIKQTREKVSREIAGLIPLAQGTIDKLGQDLRLGNEEALAQMRRLRDDAVEVGLEVGRCQGILQVSEWLNELHALVRGEEALEDTRVRIIVLSVVRALYNWLKHHGSYSLQFSSLSFAAERMISELEAWEA